MSHVLKGEDGEVIRPICYASCSLSPRQQNYAQLDREAFAIILAVTRFHKFIFGRKFTIITDNEPVKFIFSPPKGLSALTNHRLQHWAIILQMYDELKHCNTEQNCPADALSRLPSNVNIHEIYIKDEFDELPRAV